MKFPSPHSKFTELLVSLGVRPHYIIGLDSATAALQATAKYLHGKELRSGGFAPGLSASFLDAASHLPDRWIEIFSTWSGWMDASSPRVLDEVRAETMSRWVVKQYPKRRYPGVMIGSSNGAAVHLCAALGIPYLPQTLLTCVRHSSDRDDPKQKVEWAKANVRRLLARNPDLWAYQMHDPNQDRLKVSRVAYFRLKRTRLGETFKQFVKENIEPGGTIFLLECQYRWLSTHVGVSEAGRDSVSRHLFQFGGKGELAPGEYFEHSQEIADFLKRRGSKHRQWNPPAPDGRYPESEWGFEPALREDVEQFAREHGLRVRRIVFDFPQDLSPLVADLYRWWYEQRGLPSDRLFVESFTYLQPWWTVRLGLVPFWTVFNDQMSANRLDLYLDSTEPYDEIYMTLFSNGLESLGIASIDRWRSILNRARKHGDFIGVNEQKYPRDVSSFVRHYTDLKKLDGRYPIPEPLKLYQLDNFLAQAGVSVTRSDSNVSVSSERSDSELACAAGDPYPVRWIEHPMV